MTDRRQFLGTLGRMLGSAGLLLPLGGRGALALNDMKQAASLPTTLASLPFSAEALLLRDLRRELHRERKKNDPSKAGHARWRSLVGAHYRPTSIAIASRDKPTWTDCVELAEIIWEALDKERRNGEPTGALNLPPDCDRSFGGRRLEGDSFMNSAYWCREAIVALVEAVLTLGEGERFDPRTEQGLWPGEVKASGLMTGGRRNV